MEYYSAGDIVLLGNMVFLDDGSIDVKTNKRPFIHIIDYDFMMDGGGYLLKLSTDEVLYKQNKRRYHPLMPNKYNKLKRKSYVDLHYVYRSENKEAKVVGYVDDRTLNFIISKLNIQQEEYEKLSFL